MGKSTSRRAFLGGAGAALAYAPHVWAAAPEASLRPALRGADHYKRAAPSIEAITGPLSGHVTFAVADAETGAWLECLDEKLATPPASVTKALTALYALDVLGPEHRFATRVAATGGTVNGTVQGDLLLIGGGDPTLDTDHLAELAAGLKAAGVHSVKGAFKVFEASLPVLREIDPFQPAHVGYNPAVSGLALNFNRVHFEWRRASSGYTVTMDGRSATRRPEVQMARMRIVDRAVPVYTYADSGARDEWTVARGALGRGGARWLPVRRPGLYAGEVFATMAGAHGIRLGAPQMITELPPHETVAQHESGDLLGILRDMLRFSTNVTAEMVGLSATAARVAVPESLAASAAEMNRWARDTLGMDAPQLVDHSGLGDASRLTALDMVRALRAANAGGLRPILKTFGFRDARGRPVKDQAIAVDAKTGTLNFVSALAGYVTAADGREMVFAIFAADLDKRGRITRADRERPAGGRTWNRAAKRVQQALIERWDLLYGKLDA